ncbi:hypothetical protein FOZ60_006803 [Perkinsus olseni]|uniref:Uncharacterized protein n=1 Tax=Perkinsus olseni TaxID=32597 RepID=A0A7J6NMW7_PEROL|nr:hypothetical protein FOZ60_006803 [Perkinsus olseni]
MANPGSTFEKLDLAKVEPEVREAVADEDLEEEVVTIMLHRAVVSSAAPVEGGPSLDWQLAGNPPQRFARPPTRFSPSAWGRSWTLRFKTVPRHENGCRRLDFDSVVKVDFVGYAINEVCFYKDQRDGITRRWDCDYACRGS